MQNNNIEKEYYRRLKNIGPQNRLKIAFELENLTCEIAKEGIKNKYRSNDINFINRELKKRIHLAEELEKLWIKKKPS